MYKIVKDVYPDAGTFDIANYYDDAYVLLDEETEEFLSIVLILNDDESISIYADVWFLDEY